MSSEESSDDSESEDTDDELDPEEVDPIDVDELLEEMQARREEQRAQVTYEWCETIRRVGERYREREDVEAVANNLSKPKDEIREAFTVYRLIFQEPPGTVAMIASRTGRAFFTIDTDVTEAIDLDVLNDPVEELVREYVGAIYLEYDVNEEPVGDPVERDVPERPIDLEEFGKTIADSVLVPTGALTAATAMDRLNKRVARKLTVSGADNVAASGINQMLESLLMSQANLQSAAIQPMLDRQQELLHAAVSPALEQIARQQEAIATTALESVAASLEDIVFPESVLADWAASQPTIDAATMSPSPDAASGYSPVSQPSVSTPEPTPTDTDPVGPSVSPDTSAIEASMEPTVEPTAGAPVASTVDATLPGPDTVSPELVFEIPAMMVQTILTTGQARSWFTSLPQDHQITVVNVILISATLYVTGNPTFAALAPFIAPSVRRMIVEGEV